MRGTGSASDCETPHEGRARPIVVCPAADFAVAADEAAAVAAAQRPAKGRVRRRDGVKSTVFSSRRRTKASSTVTRHVRHACYRVKFNSSSHRSSRSSAVYGFCSACRARGRHMALRINGRRIPERLVIAVAALYRARRAVGGSGVGRWVSVKSPKDLLFDAARMIVIE